MSILQLPSSIDDLKNGLEQIIIQTRQNNYTLNTAATYLLSNLSEKTNAPAFKGYCKEIETLLNPKRMSYEQSAAINWFKDEYLPAAEKLFNNINTLGPGDLKNDEYPLPSNDIFNIDISYTPLWRKKENDELLALLESSQPDEQLKTKHTCTLI